MPSNNINPLNISVANNNLPNHAPIKNYIAYEDYLNKLNLEQFNNSHVLSNISRVQERISGEWTVVMDFMHIDTAVLKTAGLSKASAINGIITGNSDTIGNLLFESVVSLSSFQFRLLFDIAIEPMTTLTSSKKFFNIFMLSCSLCDGLPYNYATLPVLYTMVRIMEKRGTPNPYQDFDINNRTDINKQEFLGGFNGFAVTYKDIVPYVP